MGNSPGRLAAGLAALFGAGVAAWMYGWRVLDPRSAGWLLHGDPAQHYLGSVFFRAEPWHWPPGAILRFGDAPTSVVFTDSIPLLALPLKLLDVPAHWQYFGPWMLLCHALAGWFGVRLLQRLGVGGVRAALGGAFFAISPALLLRAYGHEALMAQFLVLAALAQGFSDWRWRSWLLIAALAVLVHPYLALMVCVLGTAAAIAALVRGEMGATGLVAQGAGASVVLASLAWAAGYFVGHGEISAGGHGFFSANLLTWFDPMDWQAFARTHGVEAPYVREWSRWLPPLGQATQGQYEGFAYLGAGMLALALAAFVAPRAHRVSLSQAAGQPPQRWAAALASAGLLAALAVSARPSFGPMLLAEIPLPGWSQQALGVFRASGRFIWPLTLLLMAWLLCRVAHRRAGLLLLSAGLLLQVGDLHGKLKEFRARFRVGPPGVAAPVSSPAWQQLFARCPRLELVSAAAGSQWVGPALAAAAAGAAMSPAPTARLSPQAVAAAQAQAADRLKSQSWRADTVYQLAAPLPGGQPLEAVLQSLPAGMRHVLLDGRTLVVPARCLE